MELEGGKELVDTGSHAARGVCQLYPFVWPLSMCSRAFVAGEWLFLALNCSF